MTKYRSRILPSWEASGTAARFSQVDKVRTDRGSHRGSDRGIGVRPGRSKKIGHPHSRVFFL